MTRGRWLFVCAVFAAACGGKSASQDSGGGSLTDAGGGDPTDAGGGRPTDADCRTSFACPAGERCDDGACVPDDNCPDARDHELLFEETAGPSWIDLWYLTVLDGREYLVTGELDEAGGPGELSRLVDLRTGRELRFVHERGHVGCSGTPARCQLRIRGELAIVEIELGVDTVSMREETLFVFPGYEHFFWSDADYRDRRVVTSAGARVELIELGKPPPIIASIDLEGRSPTNLVVGADGRGEGIVSWKQENQVTAEPAEVAISALETGARPRLVYRGPGGFSSAVLALPNGDDWFALRDGRSDEPAVSVYRSGGTLVGALDAPWAMKVDYEYRTRERPLEPGPSAYVRHCDESGCASHRFFLDPVSLEEVASVALPEPGILGFYSRAIACGGADLWVATEAGPESPTRYWSMRIPGRAGFP